MTTLLDDPMVFEVSRWTLYNSVNLRLSSGDAKAVELLVGLLAEVAAVHEKEDSARPRILDQPVDGRDGEDRLARPGRHLHEGTGPVARERLLDVDDRLDLIREEEPLLQGRQRLEPRAE